MSRPLRILRALTPLLALLAGALIALIVAAAVSGHGARLLAAQTVTVTCPDGRADHSPTRTLAAAHVTVRYATGGCNAATVAAARRAGAVWDQQAAALNAAGLPFPAAATTLRLADSDHLTVDASVHRPATVTAPALATPAQLAGAAAQASLAQAAPGLNARDRAVAAGAYALLSGPAAAPARDAATFTAWVAARGGGPNLLAQALGDCRTPCTLSSALRSAAHGHHLDLTALARRFVAGAPARQRAALAAELR